MSYHYLGLKPECDYAAENITFDEFAKGSFDLIAYGKKIDHIQLNCGRYP
mgnify:CR=1 FL=1